MKNASKKKVVTPAQTNVVPGSSGDSTIDANMMPGYGIAHMADGGVVNTLRGIVGLPPSTDTIPTVTSGARAANGGHLQGPGTGTSDDIPIMGSNGEYMLPADTTKAIGVKNLDAIKAATHTPSGKTQGYGAVRMADGGVVPDDSFNTPQGVPTLGSAVASGASKVIGGIGGLVAENMQPDTPRPQPTGKPGLDNLFGQGQVANIDAINKVAAENPGGRTAQFLGGIGKPNVTTANPAASQSIPQATPAAPAASTGGVYPPGDPRGTMSGSIGTNGSIPGTTPSAPAPTVNAPAPQAQQTVPQQKPIVGKDGLATDAAGNPIAGYGSISVNGKQTNLSPTSTGASAQLGINKPTQSNVLTMGGVPVTDLMNKHYKEQMQQKEDIAMMQARSQVTPLPSKMIKDADGNIEYTTPGYLTRDPKTGEVTEHTSQSTLQSTAPQKGNAAIQSMSQEIQAKATAIKSKLASGAISRAQAVQQLNDLGIK